MVRDKLQTLYESPKSLQLIQLVEQEAANPITKRQLQVRLGLSEEQIEKWISSEEKLFWLSYNQSKWLLTIDQWKKTILSGAVNWQRRDILSL